MPNNAEARRIKDKKKKDKEKKRVVGHVSGEGLAPIVSANSRLILVDGTVL